MASRAARITEGVTSFLKWIGPIIKLIDFAQIFEQVVFIHCLTPCDSRRKSRGPPSPFWVYVQKEVNLKLDSNLEWAEALWDAFLN